MSRRIRSDGAIGDYDATGGLTHTIDGAIGDYGDRRTSTHTIGGAIGDYRSLHREAV